MVDDALGCHNGVQRVDLVLVDIVVAVDETVRRMLGTFVGEKRYNTISGFFVEVM